MQRRFRRLSAFVTLVLAVLSSLPAFAIDEPERLWLVGERAFADGLYPVARRALERFVDRSPMDERTPRARLMLGKSLLTLGELEAALDAFRRTGTEMPPAGVGFETKFWEAETLFRLKRYAEASAAYDDVLRKDASAPFAPDALYGYGWAQLELKRPEPAIAAFRDFLQTWSEHALAPSASYHLARALVEMKRYPEALTLLSELPKKYPGHPLVADAEYLEAATRLASGDTKRGLAAMRAFVDAHPAHAATPEGRRLLRDTLARTGDASQLQEVYASLMSQSPATAEALAEAHAIARRTGRPRDEEAAWRKLRTDFPDHALTHRTALDLASAAFKRKDWKDAAGYAETASRSSDDALRAEAWLLAGESELKLRRYPAAVKAFEEVGTIANVDPSVRFRALAGVGLAREEQKDWRAALTAYEAVAARSPDTALRQWARERAGVVKTRIAKPPAKPKGSS